MKAGTDGARARLRLDPEAKLAQENPPGQRQTPPMQVSINWIAAIVLSISPVSAIRSAAGIFTTKTWLGDDSTARRNLSAILKLCDSGRRSRLDIGPSAIQTWSAPTSSEPPSK